MKKILLGVRYAVYFILVFCSACKKDDNNSAGVASPVSNLRYAVNGHNVKLLWDNPGGTFDNYVIELSRTADFAKINATQTLDKSAVEHIFWKLLPAEDYHFRIKTTAGNNESEWVKASFNTKNSNVLLPVNNGDIQASEVTIKWEVFDDKEGKSATDLSKIVLKPFIGEAIELPVTPSDKQAKSKKITSLQKDMQYTVSIYNGAFRMGSQTFATAAEAVNGVWTLSQYSNLYYAINTAANGDKLLLKKGIYDLSLAEIEINNKNVSIEAAADDALNRPTLYLRGFLLNGSNAGVSLKGLTLSGARINENKLELPNAPDHHWNSWLFAVKLESPGFNAVLIDNCTLRNYWGGILNLNDGGRPPHKLGNSVTINNSIVTELGGDNDSHTLQVRAGQIKKGSFTNSTFYKTNKMFIAIDAEKNLSNVIEFNFSNNTVDNSWSAGSFDFKAVKAPSTCLLKSNCFSNIVCAGNFLPNFAFVANDFDKRLINTNFYNVLSKSTIYGKNSSNMPVASWELRHPNTKWNEVVPAFIMNNASHENPNSIKEYPAAFDPGYKNAAAGDFTISASSGLRTLDSNKPIGDPRWW